MTAFILRFKHRTEGHDNSASTILLCVNFTRTCSSVTSNAPDTSTSNPGLKPLQNGRSLRIGGKLPLSPLQNSLHVGFWWETELWQLFFYIINMSLFLHQEQRLNILIQALITVLLYTTYTTDVPSFRELGDGLPPTLGKHQWCNITNHLLVANLRKKEKTLKDDEASQACITNTNSVFGMVNSNRYRLLTGPHNILLKPSLLCNKKYNMLGANIQAVFIFVNLLEKLSLSPPPHLLSAFIFWSVYFFLTMENNVLHLLLWQEVWMPAIFLSMTLASILNAFAIA